MKGLKPERYKNLNREQKKWLKLLAAAILVVALSAVSFFLANSILSNPNVYNGITIDGKDVGGMSPVELGGYLKERYGTYLKDINITFFTNDYEKSVSLTDLGISVDTESMGKKALGTGREGFFISRLFEISRLKKHPVYLPMELIVNEAQLGLVTEDVNLYFKTDVTVPNVIISGDTAVLCTGVSGWEVDKEQLRIKIMESLKSLKTCYIHIPVKEVFPPKIDIDAVCSAIVQEPADAEIVNEKGAAIIKPQTNGRSIEKNALADIVNHVEERELKDYQEIKLPVTVTEPKIKTADLEALLYRDVLSKVSTSFTTTSPNNKNRGINIRLAAQSINGTVLFPGDEFSFNGVVGPRTSDKGYVIAHVFAEGQVKDGYGGGICQVSTTLYDAALFSNFNISERHNHIFAVGYVPLGLDAAVSYGYSDLKFTNTTDYPIRINAEVSDNNILTFSISGTNLYSNVEVKALSKTIKITRATIEYIDDPTLPVGTEITENDGIDGAVVDTYVQIYSGNDLIKDYKLHTSTYTMLPKKVRRGVYSAAGQAVTPLTELQYAGIYGRIR